MHIAAELLDRFITRFRGVASVDMWTPWSNDTARPVFGRPPAGDESSMDESCLGRPRLEMLCLLDMPCGILTGLMSPRRQTAGSLELGRGCCSPPPSPPSPPSGAAWLLSVASVAPSLPAFEAPPPAADES